MMIWLSVVVAVWGDDTNLDRCLAAFLNQFDAACELIVATAVEPHSAYGADLRVRWLRLPESALIPELWSRGMEVASGQFVAITTSHFEPAPGWARAVLSAGAEHGRAGFGGPIDAPRGGTAKDWATYFLRYSNTFHLKGAQNVPDIPGDNAVYAAAALKRHRVAMARGFWEPEFHRLVLAEGATLAWVPEMRVIQRASYPFQAFCRQRLLHGREFGSSRVRGRSVWMQLSRLMLSPLIPFVYLAKIGARVARDGRYVGAFIYALPVLFLFVLVWAAGETWGYLAPLRTDQTIEKRATT
ncbi:MAG: glycosyltransferase [Burkholderiales bacterium]|nr:glycosyltransferase [Burkholderiales bacterium]